MKLPIKDFNFQILALLVLGLALMAIGAAVITKTSQFPQVTAPGTNDLFFLGVPGTGGVFTAVAGATNNQIKYSDLRSAIRTNIDAGEVNSGTLSTNRLPTLNKDLGKLIGV